MLWIDTLHVDGAAAAFRRGARRGRRRGGGTGAGHPALGAGLQSPGQRTMTGDRAQRRLRSTLVAVEVALALMLVSGTGLLLKSFVNLVNVDTGFRQDGVMVLQMFAWDRNPGPPALRTFLDRVIAKVGAIPGVEAVGAVQAMPFIEANVDIRGTVRLMISRRRRQVTRSARRTTSPRRATSRDGRPRW